MLASPAIQNDSVCHISFVFCGRDQKFLALLSLLFSLEAVFMLHYCLTYKSANIEEKADWNAVSIWSIVNELIIIIARFLNLNKIRFPRPTRNLQFKRSIRVIKDIIYENRLHSFISLYATALYTQFMIEVPKGLAAELDLPDIGRKKSFYYGLFLD